MHVMHFMQSYAGGCGCESARNRSQGSNSKPHIDMDAHGLGRPIALPFFDFFGGSGRWVKTATSVIARGCEIGAPLPALPFGKWKEMSGVCQRRLKAQAVSYQVLKERIGGTRPAIICNICTEAMFRLEVLVFAISYGTEC